MTIIKKFDPEKYDKSNSSQGKKFSLYGFLVLVLLVVIDIWINHTVVDHGEKLDNISRLQQSLKTENMILENEIAQNSSINKIASKSAEYGFIEPKNIQYIR